MGEEKDPWLMRADESAKAFAAFELYCELGPHRSHERVRGEIGKRSGKKAPDLRWIETWSSRFGWVERARAWDEHQAALRAKAREQRVIEAEELLKDAAPEVVESLLSIVQDEMALPTARVSAGKDLLDRAGVGKRKQEDKISATGEVATALAAILGRAALEPKKDGD